MTAYAYENLNVDVTDRIATVTINRPKVLNALNAPTVDELSACFETLRDDSGVGAAILTGAGDKAFIAGADISEFPSMGPHEAKRFAHRGQRMCRLIEDLGKPVIAAVNGFALGGGCEVALACHLRYLSDNARIGLPEVTLGIIPGYGGTQRLPRLVGRGLALEMILTGKMLGAEEAKRIGLANDVFPQAELLAAARATAAKILKNGPLAVRFCLEAVDRGLDDPLAAGLAHEANLFGLAFATKDMVEGTTAFLEKRPPAFTGE